LRSRINCQSSVLSSQFSEVKDLIDNLVFIWGLKAEITEYLVTYGTFA